MKKLSKFLEDSQNKAPMRINGFAILKPGFLSYEEPFCNMLQNNGWNIIEKKRCKLTPDQAAKLYVNLNEKPFYNDLCQYMSSDNCLCCRCSKDCEDPIGDMKALKTKVRDQWGIDDMRNAMHSSDSQEAVDAESKLCMECNGVAESLNEANENITDVVENPDVYNNELVHKLQVAFAEEINAWYQYLIVIPFLHGQERKNIEEFYKTAAEDEYEDHALWLLNRINELGHTPDEILDMYQLNNLADHKFIIPNNDFDVKKSLLQNIEAEKGAIETYIDLVNFTKGIDPVTHRKMKQILADEQEHLTELNDFLADIQ